MHLDRARPRWRRVLLGGLTLVVAATVALALPATSRAEDPPRDADARLVVPPEGMVVVDLLQAVSSVTRRTISWDPADKALHAMRIQVTGDLTAPRDGLFDLVRALLFTREIVLVPVGGPKEDVWYAASVRELASSVTLKMRPTQVDADDVSLASLARQDGFFVTTTVAVRNLDNLSAARAALQRLVTANNIGSVTELPDARAFVVTDFAPNVVAICRLIREMDQAALVAPSVVEFVAVRHALAENVAWLLGRIFSGSDAGQPSQPNPLPASRRALRLVADPWTNTIVVAGPKDEVRSVLEALQRLDREPAVRPQPPPGLAKPAVEPTPTPTPTPGK